MFKSHWKALLNSYYLILMWPIFQAAVEASLPPPSQAHTRSTRGSQSFVNSFLKKRKEKEKSTWAEPECASSCKAPPPRFCALARFTFLPVALCSSLGGGGGLTLLRAAGKSTSHMSAAGSARPGPVAGPVQQGLKEALIETLTAILSPVQEVRAAAEEQIKVLEVTEGEW